MKVAIVTLLCSLIGSGSALAVVDPEPDHLGFYFDQSADVYEIFSNDMLQGYLIVTNPTFEAITGLECNLDWEESGCMFLGMILPAGGLNIGDHHNVVMGLSSPLWTAEATVMATYNLLPTGAALFALAGSTSPSIPGDLPVVVDGEDNMFQLGLAAGPGVTCASINVNSGPALSQTWGGVKNLYR